MVMEVHGFLKLVTVDSSHPPLLQSCGLTSHISFTGQSEYFTWGKADALVLKKYHL